MTYKQNGRIFVNRNKEGIIIAYKTTIIPATINLSQSMKRRNLKNTTDHHANQNPKMNHQLMTNISANV